jgi:ABC-type lipoprotein release transport system permease subunit
LQPSDPTTIGASVAGLAVVAIAASLLPAMRAARVEPMVALREE